MKSLPWNYRHNADKVHESELNQSDIYCNKCTFYAFDIYRLARRFTRLTYIALQTTFYAFNDSSKLTNNNAFQEPP